MKEKDFDQIKMELGTGSENIVNAAQSNNDNPQRKIKRQKDPKTISFHAQYFEGDDEDELVSPKSDLFKKLSSDVSDSSYTKEFHDSNHNADEDKIKVDETFKSTSKADQQFFSTFGLNSGSQSLPTIDEKKGQSSSEIETLQGDIHSDYYEFTDRQQRKEIVGMYKYARKNIKTKTIIASIFAIILFFIENLGLFIKEPTGFLANPYIVASANIVVFLVCIALAYEQLYHGAKSIFSKDYIAESVVVVAIICAIIHSLLSVLFISFSDVELYNFPVAVMIVLVLVYSYINVIREKYGFSVVSSKDVKFYLEKAPRGNDDAETETFSTTSTEFEGDIARVKRTAFVKGYFANTNSTPNLHSYLSVYYTFALLIPVVLAVFSIFRDYDFYEVISVWYKGVLFMLPVGILFSYSFPFFIANKRLYNDEVSIIGENAIGDFANASIVSVNDTTAFPPYNVKLTNFQVFNGFKTEKVLYYAASGFATVGGPLADVFDVATKDAFQKSKKTKFVCSGRSYLCIKIDGDTIIFADRYGMSSQGIDVGFDKEDNDDISVMYMACNGTLCSKMYLKYVIDDEFVNIALNLNKSKIGVGIRTYDPNINNELLRWQINQKRYDIKVIRLSNEEDIPTTTARAEGKIVSRGPSKHLLKAVPLCKSIVKIRKATRALKIISTILGAVILGLYIYKNITLTASILASGYILALMLIMFLITVTLMPKSK